VRVLTDSHAHLSLVAEELGRDALDELLASYALTWDEAADSPVADPPAQSLSPTAQPLAKPLLVDIGVEPGDFEARFALLGERPYLRYALGIWPGHPWVDEVAAALAGLERSLEAAGPRASAIGECGLDYHYEEESAAAQRELFEGQIEIAARRGLPMVVHSREAAADTLSILKSAAKLPRTVIHCFGYGAAEAEAFLALGCAISFAGNVTFKMSEGLNAALRLVPEERLLLETDSPYMNPMPRRGKPSSSADIERTYAYAAAARMVDGGQLAQAVSRNALEIFGQGSRPRG
jgi:TatD DNase family protein